MKKNTKTLKAHAVETPLFKAGGDLSSFIMGILPDLSVLEGSVLAVSSKLFSLAENQVVHTDDKQDLIKKEADHYLGQGGYGFHLTIKEGLILPSAGVDQSNSPTGGYLLLPKQPYLSLKKLWSDLRSKGSLRNFGLLMTDSRTTPLRRGVTGVALAHWGFKAVRDMRGQEDLYKRKLTVTTVNNVDALAGCAVWLMSEGGERRPLALIENVDLKWQDHSSKEEIHIPLEEDLYSPLFRK